MNRRIVVAIVLLAVVSCTSGQTLPAVAPEAAVEFRLEDMQGRMHTLSDYRGEVLVINFWATWCPPCVEEMPSLQRAWQRLREEGVQVLAVNMGDPAEAVERFLALYPVDFPVLLDRDVTVAESWGVKGLPTTFVVDSDGVIVYRVVGEREWDDPELLDQVLALP